jgi:hypothetical protein
LPNVQRMNQIAVGETVEEILRADMPRGQSPRRLTRGSPITKLCATSSRRPADAHSRERRALTSLTASLI